MSRLVLLALGLVLTLGCERMALIKKCRGLAQRVNPELDAIEASVTAKQDAPTYQAVSERYTALAKEVGAFDAGAPDIDRAAADYANTLRSSGRKLGELASAVDAGLAESAAVSRRELEQEAKRQKNVAKRFRQECQGH